MEFFPARFKDGAVAKLKEIFFKGANGDYSRAVKDFFATLANLFELEAARRTLTPAPQIKKIEIAFPMLDDFKEAEIVVLRRSFIKWRDDFTKHDPVVADFLNELAIALDDICRERRKANKELQRLFDSHPGIQSSEAVWETE